ncbi:MAG: hypothetical protein ACKO1N_05860, partial [Erythrobacter sp.]
MGGKQQRPAYEFVDMNTTGPGAVATAFANQVAYCDAAGAHITARICAEIGALLATDKAGDLLDRIR